MNGFLGVARILRYNWPWYAAAVAGSALAVAVILVANPGGRWMTVVIAAVALGDAWLLLSLAVSHWIYDRSPIAHGGWLEQDGTATVVIIHAGHDEASSHVARRLPGAVCTAFDIFDPAHGASPSLLRARSAATARAPVAATGRIPLPDGSADLVLMVFAAHEVRAAEARTELLRELGRIAGARGRILVVEHQRDFWNLLAYGPGALHFLTRKAWMGTFEGAGLLLTRDDAITPWIHRFELRKAA
jgi:SAM-dependent methyltransferase